MQKLERSDREILMNIESKYLFLWFQELNRYLYYFNYYFTNYYFVSHAVLVSNPCAVHLTSLVADVVGLSFKGPLEVAVSLP